MTRSHAWTNPTRVIAVVSTCLSLVACENFAAPETTAPASTAAAAASAGTTPTVAPTEGAESAPRETAAPGRDRVAEDEIRAAMANINDRWAQCGASLPACDEAAFAQALTDPLLSVTQDWVRTQNEAGVTATDTDTITSRVDEITVDGDTAVVTTCDTNGGVLYNKDGSVLDGEYFSSINVWSLVRMDGRWLARGRTAIEKVAGVTNNICVR